MTFAEVIFLKEAVKNFYDKWMRFAVIGAALVFFAVRSVQMIMQISTTLALPAATLYLLDFNFYIGSRTFIGSVLTLLTEHITYQQIFALNIAVYVSMIIAFFALGMHTVKLAVKEDNNFMFLLAALFIVCPYSVMQYASWVGTYDIYLCLFAVLCGVLSGTKRMNWLCPVICVIAIFTHYAFVFSYFPAVLSVQIYGIITNENRKSSIVSAVVGFVASFVSAVYCGFFADGTIKMTRDELYAYMENRLGMPVENKPYIDSYYFEEDVFGMLSGFKNSIVNDEFIKNFVLFFLPVMLLFVALWCYYIIKNSNKQIVAGVFFILTAVCSIALIFLIIEAPRWQAAAILSQFIILFTVMKKKDSAVTELMGKINILPVNVAMIVFIVYNISASFIIKPFFS